MCELSALVSCSGDVEALAERRVKREALRRACAAEGDLGENIVTFGGRVGAGGGIFGSKKVGLDWSFEGCELQCVEGAKLG